MTTPDATVSTSLTAAAYRRVYPRIIAVPAKETLPVNLQVTAVVEKVLKAVHDISGLREQIGKLPGLDFVAIDSLADYAWALLLAEGAYRGALAPEKDLPKLIVQGKELRSLLVQDARLMIRRGLLTTKALAHITSSRAPNELSSDLLALQGMYVESREKLSGFTSVQPAERRLAIRLSEDLTTATEVAKRAPAVIAEAKLRRAQVFTLLAKAYAETLRAVAFLRPEEGAAAKLMPPLHAMPRTGKVRQKRARAAAKATKVAAKAAVRAPAVPPPPVLERVALPREVPPVAIAESAPVQPVANASATPFGEREGWMLTSRSVPLTDAPLEPDAPSAARGSRRRKRTRR